MIETRYARSGGAHIAYQVMGDGPLDLVMVPGWISHLDLDLENALSRSFFDDLASFSRLIRFDKRGTGLSDRALEGGSLEDRVDEIAAVMEAAGSERAAIFGFSEGGAMSFAFSAMHPERTTALVLYGSLAGPMRGSPTFPCGYESEPVDDAMQRAISEHWGEGTTIDLVAPTLAQNEAARAAVGRYERLAASPGAAAAKLRANVEGDVSHLLPAVHVPTLVLHREADRMVPLCHGQALAAGIAGARLVVLPGEDHLPWVGDADIVVDEIREFLTGVRHSPDADQVVLTVAAWATSRPGPNEQLDQTIERLVTLGGGNRITSDLATFDGPARAIRTAGELADAGAAHGTDLRIALHAGECSRRGATVAGFPVDLAKGLAGRARSGEVLVSGTVKDLVAGSGLRFVERGREHLGDLGDWSVFVPAPDTQHSSASLTGLTTAELRVSTLVAEGLGNPAIAQRLHMSRHTVESHLKHIYRKLGISSRVELAARVLRR